MLLLNPYKKNILTKKKAKEKVYDSWAAKGSKNLKIWTKPGFDFD